MDLSKRWAASTADTIAPSRADRSQVSSVTRNLRAKLKNAAGPLEALTAMTCRGFSSPDSPEGPLCEERDVTAEGFCSSVGVPGDGIPLDEVSLAVWNSSSSRGTPLSGVDRVD